MLIWSGCHNVAHSAFVDFQGSHPDFDTFVKAVLDPKTFKPAKEKDQLPLFIPAEFVQGKLVRRSNNNVLSVQMGVLDLDHGSVDEQRLTLDIVKSYGHVVYTSFSHDPNGQHKRRTMVKFSRSVNVTEWRQFFPRMLLHFKATETADKKCADPCHMYYVPGGDFSNYEVFGDDGPPVDVDAILAMSLPEGMAEKPIEDYDDILPEDQRGTIGDGLREIWNGKLVNLIDEIENRPYPGSIYDLKVHQVFGLARGVPHIMSAERLRNSVVIALDRRYRTAQTDEDTEMVPVYQEKSIQQVEKAVADGMQQPWWPPKSNEIISRPLTELGLAERLVDQHGQNIRWEPTWKNWLGWNNKYWNLEAGLEVVRNKLESTIRSIPQETHALSADYLEAKKHFIAVAADEKVSDAVRTDAEVKYERLKKQIEEINKFALKCETGSKFSNGVTLATHKPEILTDYRVFDQNPWLVNFNNGTLDLRTGDFGPHKREDFLTRTVPYNYDPDAKCPRFDAFMRDFMQENERMIAFLWRVMGYTACGVTDEQKIFVLHGDGANGKSTLLNLLVDIFGEGSSGYGIAANSENLLSTRNSSKHETWRMSLAGTRIVSCQEVDEGRSFAESLLKELTGSDKITGRKLYQNEWSYKPQFTLWLAVNHLPHVRGTDEGIWRRLCVIECPANFRNRPDRDMPRRLLLEAPGIWTRLAREARAWIRERLTLPREVVVSNTMYRHEQDPLRDFVERWCIIDAEAVEARPTIWAAYEEYCAAEKIKTFHERKRFYAALEKQFAIKKIHGQRFFAGLRVKTQKERIESTPRAVLQRALAAREEEPLN
ncbi:MAG: phage/plasmid primase, P4 family [Anaerolineae bacterium]